MSLQGSLEGEFVIAKYDKLKSSQNDYKIAVSAQKAATLRLLENLGLTQIRDSRHARTEFAIAGIHEARLSADDS